MSISAYGSITVTDLLDTATYIYYAATNSTTYSDWHTSPQTTDKYIGIYSGPPVDGGQPANPTSAIYNAMDISKYVGEDGSQGPEGPQGPAGPAGKMLYGTCNTTVSTTAKVVACSDATQLYDGLIINVKCTTANSVAAPTLNVNNLGAKAVFFNNAITATANAFKWASNSTIQFMYDSSLNSSAGAWVPVGYPLNYYGTASTAEGTTAKTSTITSAVICKGTTISILFSTRNTANAPTLNISSTGATAIYYNNAITSSTNFLTWEPNTVVNFMFDGRYWRYQGARNKYFGMNSTVGAYVASGISGTTFSENDLTTYGYNVTMGAYNSENAFRIGYNGNYTMKLSGSNLSFFRVTSVDTNGNIAAVSSNPSMVLNSNGLAFYDGGNSNKLLAEFSSTGYIQSGNYDAPDTGETFADAGTLISLQTGEIITEYFRTNNDGAWFSGNITANSGTIGGWKINPNALTADRTSSTGGETQTNFIILSDGNSNISREIMGQTRTDWSFAIGTNIGISADGLLYATSAYLDNGTLGFLNFSSDSLFYPNILKVTTAPSVYTTPITDEEDVVIFTPAYRIALSTVKQEADVLEVKVDTALEYSNNLYFVGYVDSNYVYIGEINNSRLTISKDGILLGKKGATDYAIQLMNSGDVLIGSTTSGDYLTYVNDTETITFKVTNLNASAGVISQLSATQIDTDTISIDGVPFSTTLSNISARFDSAETNLSLLASNLANNYYTKLEINDKDTTLRTEINNAKQSIIEDYLMFLNFDTASSLTAGQMNLGKDVAHPIVEIRNTASEASSTSFGISKQLFFETDDNGKKWASRFGAIINGKPNLNDVWIGG